MHERALFEQVVKMVEAAVKGQEPVGLLTIRLKVSALSHLHDLDPSWIKSAFAEAARGTVAEGAMIEMMRVPVRTWCGRCGTGDVWRGDPLICRSCGSLTLELEEPPEVVLHELVVAG
ncbi:MAG TPA: hydrogenase maturation nickel metallochaperone HypA [Nitrospiraceae bacterium]|jgi:hydrogenase nickel incorporation protein HypA/HybF|nr:hydrogenase maturation nickel metallochaperone HypA [Nitrospiraceae bacterium]